MAAVILTLVLSFLLGGGAWAALGARLTIDAADQERNDVLNLLAYIGIAMPIAFVCVFIVLGGW